MKKIIFVANTDWYLYNFRHALIHNLQDQGWLPILVSPSGKYSQKFTKEGFQHIEWKVGRQTIMPWNELPSIKQLHNIYKISQPDLIHHHTNKAVLYGTIAAHNSGIPLINSIPGRGFAFSSTTLKARIIKPILELLFYFFLRPYKQQHMIFENRTDQEYFIKKSFIPSNKTTLIPSVGVDLSRFDSTPSKNKKELVIAYIGRMLWSKGVGEFSKAAKIMKEKNIPAKMVLIGLPDYDNPDYVPESKIKNWVDMGILEWWGWQDNMREVYQKIDILAQPTQYGEGVPTTLIEAAASRRALVASDWPGCREFIKHRKTGLLVKPGDSNDLAQKIIEMVQNKSLRFSIIEKAYELALSNFSANIVNSRTKKIYIDLLSQF